MGEGLILYQIFKKGAFTGPQFLVGVAGKEAGDLFQGGEGGFYMKNKLKYEIFNDKKNSFMSVIKELKFMVDLSVRAQWNNIP